MKKIHEQNLTNKAVASNKIIHFRGLNGVRALAAIAVIIAHISSSLIDHEVISVITVVVILTQIKRKNYIIDLDSKPFDFIGKISYGIYIYHPLVIFFYVKYFGTFTNDKWYNYIIIFLLIIITTFFISYISFNFFEKRFIKLKQKYSSVISKA